MAHNNDLTRREFMYRTAMVGGSLLLANPMNVFAVPASERP
jgi:hypothetical protein